MAKRTRDKVDILQGTLELLILRNLLFGPMHGHGIAKTIQRKSDDMLTVEHGSLYPALYRLEQKKWISSKWEHTEKGRPMKFYRLTTLGRKQLTVEQSKWKQLVRAMSRAMRPQED
jgi:PadR family transcriptional regulator PadR